MNSNDPDHLKKDEICTRNLTEKQIAIAKSGRCIECGKNLNEPGFEHSVDAGAVRCNECIKRTSNKKRSRMADLKQFAQIFIEAELY